MSRTTQVPSASPNPIFAYGAVTRYGRLFQNRSANLSVEDRRRSFNPASAVTDPVWAPARSLATTCAITVVFFSSGYLDVSVHQVGPALGAVSAQLTGCPIRKSVLKRVFAPGHGLSQLVTSFVASESQGILHVPFSPFLFSWELSIRLFTPAFCLAAAGLTFVASASNFVTVAVASLRRSFCLS